MDREDFLSRVRQAVRTAELPPTPDVELPDLDRVDLTAMFRTRAVSVNTVVHGPVSRHGVPRAITSIASGHDAATFLAWDDLEVSGVASALASAGLDRIDHEVADDPEDRYLDYRKVDIGVTGADAGLAESGSIVLRHGAGRPRMASLVSEIHIALLDVRCIVRSLAYWAERNPIDTTNLVVITGPSRTADIELQLSVGVHGPRHLHVILIDR